MPDGAERGIFARGAKREFIEIGLADDHGTCVAKACDEGRIRGGNIPFTHTRGGRRRNTSDIDDVLDGDWDAVQRSTIAAGREIAVRGFRITLRFLCHDGDERVERRLEFVDTPKTGIGDLERGHFARPKLAGKFFDGHKKGGSKKKAGP